MNFNHLIQYPDIIGCFSSKSGKIFSLIETFPVLKVSNYIGGIKKGGLSRLMDYFEANDFKQLIYDNYKYLHKMSYMLSRNKDEAEDILQQTILLAIQSFIKLRDKKYFKTWITRILINQTKKQSKNKYLCIDNSAFRAQLNTDEIIIWDIVSRLKPIYKQVIILRYMEDMSLDEISDVIDKPVGTVKTRLHRALGLLKKELKD